MLKLCCVMVLWGTCWVGCSGEDETEVAIIADGGPFFPVGGQQDDAGGRALDAMVERVPACNDGEDNDGDGQTDFPDDPGCDSAADRNEGDEPTTPACSDELDNDGDGVADFPNDPGCSSSEDTDETDEARAPRPQCSNGRDDDGDGLVDIADPGCISEMDFREASTNDEMACMTDEDCVNYGTCMDGINRCVPQCSNRKDDDDDGVIDFPFEPGCASAGDDDETDPGVAPFCGNGIDDDSDGLVDYPNDPGCAGVGDRDESDPEILPACGDGRDNDRDGATDYPDDRGCESAADYSEGGACGRLYEAVEVTPGEVIRGDSRQGPYSAEGSCGGRGAPEVVLVYRVTKPIEAFVVRTDLDDNVHQTTLHIRRTCLDANTEIGCSREPSQDGVAANQLRIENPLLGDHYIFIDGAAGEGGRFAVVVEEVALAECLNGIDDDDDGQTDYPYDPGCETATDRTETNPETLPVCFDGMDNDFDGRIDFPLDAGCISASHDDEVERCGTGLRISAYPFGAPFILGRGDDGTASNSFAGTCGEGLGLEKVYLYRNPHNVRMDISVDFPETTPQTEVYVRGICVSPATEVGCNAGTEENGRRGTLTIPRASPGDYFIFVDHPNAGINGAFKLAVTTERLEPSCIDGIDNDEDGFVDADDPGCEALDDEDERDVLDAPMRPQCNDGLDNDDDGEIDYPFDPGCAARGALDETDPDERPQCSNEIDDDDDGAIDFPADSGCSSRADNGEENGRRPAQCTNRIDDDRDGLIDYPNDPGCLAFGDLSEVDDETPPACADGIDNDGDNRIDYPYEPGCVAAGDRDEADPDTLPACSNGVDDDGDGVIDFPREAGCSFAADDDESDPAFTPQCANGQDDDQNGRTDFPDDPGCRFAADSREATEGEVRTRCSDGVDNDVDGAIDLADPGCTRPLDNDETDPNEVSFCGDDEDNDGDGLVDWPADDGCVARGDGCEQSGFGLCDGVCQDVQSNNLHCGRCDRRCPPGVACQEGRCGALRRRFRLCGQSFNYRAAADYRGERLMTANIIAEAGCEPADDVQAILLTYSGRANVINSPQRYLDYLERGGQVITSRQTSHDIYNALFGTNISRPGRRLGPRCGGNIQNISQFSPANGFWIDSPFIPLSADLAGCGYAINNLPDVTLLAGWTEDEASLGYMDVGAGRIWFVESNWFEERDTFTDYSFYMMESMILGSGSGGLPPCLDGIDNDSDGLIDLFDTGCTSFEDEDEGEPEGEAACGDAVDNDNDGAIDYPFDTGCIAAGDTSEISPDEVPRCANGLDDDNDGKPDYPHDPGCSSRADDVETDEERPARCANGRDDDGDGLVDYPADPGCSAAIDEDETDDAVEPACANGRDDDRDGISDWPFDPGCLSAADE
ncbi:MAG: hypothetical protein VX589_10515, partial [Myxococcota bacterium]|nr:hypothetical protein [Myxococcota bacterium]